MKSRGNDESLEKTKNLRSIALNTRQCNKRNVKKKEIPMDDPSVDKREISSSNGTSGVS